MKSIEVAWRRILQREGERFETLTGGPFTYTVTGHVLRTDRTDFNLPKSQFEKALDLVPAAGPGELRDLRGPSYIYAILHDKRIRQADW